LSYERLVAEPGVEPGLPEATVLRTARRAAAHLRLG